MEQMKDAMKAKNEASLRGLRAIKAEIIKAKTEPGANGAVSEEGEIKLLQKMVKQRRDSLDIYQQQSRADLAQKEEEEIRVIEKFLPKQLSPEELRAELQSIITQTGAASPADMGKVMGVVTPQTRGKADGGAVAAEVRRQLAG